MDSCLWFQLDYSAVSLKNRVAWAEDFWRDLFLLGAATPAFDTPTLVRNVTLPFPHQALYQAPEKTAPSQGFRKDIQCPSWWWVPQEAAATAAAFPLDKRSSGYWKP